MQSFGQDKRDAAVPGERQPGRQLAAFNILFDFLGVQWVAGIAHHRFGLIRGLELALAVHREARRGVLRDQPLGHGGRGRHLRIEQRYGQAGQRLDQHRHDLVGPGLAAGVNHQQPRIWINPDKHRGLLGEGHGQQLQLDVVLDLAGFLLAGLAPGGGFNLGHPLLGLARDHRTGQRPGFDHQLENQLSAYGLHQRAVGLAARFAPANGFFLGGTTFDKARAIQAGLYLLHGRGPLGPDSIHDDVFEHLHPFLDD